MANYKLQEMPNLNNSGKRIVYPKVETHRTLSTDEVCEKMHAYNPAYSSSLVRTVLDDLSDFLVHMMDMGYNVKLDGLGTFSLSIGFTDNKPNEMQGDDDKMLYRKVAVKDVNYKVDAELLEKLKRKVDLRHIEGEVQKISKTAYSEEERIQRAINIIEKKGFITLADYAYTNGLSRSMASRDLKKICEKEDSPIKSSGNGSHKIWVKS